MKVALNTDKLKKQRTERIWSQEQLAEAAGLSLRTIQRIEKGKLASRESALSIAEAFGIEIDTLMVSTHSEHGKLEALEKEKKFLQFKMSSVIHLVSYLLVMAILLPINLASSPDRLWIAWPAIGWGIGVIAHIGSVYLVGYISKVEKQISYLS